MVHPKKCQPLDPAARLEILLCIPSVKTALTTWQRLTRPRSEKRRKGMKIGVGAVWGTVRPVGRVN